MQWNVGLLEQSVQGCVSVPPLHTKILTKILVYRVSFLVAVALW